MDENFNLLVDRVISSLDKSDLEKINYYLKNIKDATICTGVGGSFVVSNFMSKLLSEKNGIIAINLEPRDLLYCNKEPFKNVICSSYGGKNYGVDVSFANDLNKFLFSGCQRDGVNNINYDSGEIEKSFISLAATLIPMAILLNYYLDGDKTLIYEILGDRKINPIKWKPLFEIMSGYETSSAAIYLESTLTESGVAVPLVHDKYGFCHGRSTTGFHNDNSLIYFNSNTELDELMLSELRQYYEEVYRLDYKYPDKIVNDFYLTYKCMLLTKDMAEQIDVDLSKVDYSPVVKKLYKYKGEM